MITLQGCTSSYMFPPLSVCTRHVLGRLQAKADVGVDHDLPKTLKPLVQVYRLFRFHPQGVRPRFPHTAPNDVYRVPEIPNGYPVHRATYLPHHSPPRGQRCPWPPVGYKHQKLLATPGQRTRVDKKPRGSIGFGPNAW